MERYEYPFSALVGQEKLKTALLLNLVEPRLGGVLIQGEKGTAKSTAVRGLAELMDEVEEAEGEISAILARHNRGERSRPVKEALERAAAKERSGPGSGRKR